MSTRIKGPDGGVVEGTSRSRAPVRTPSAATGSGASSPVDITDSVHITSAAHLMLSLQQQINETPDVNTARVERLRADISQNRYQIDAGRITDRLTQLEGDLQAASKNSDTDQ